jgi:hypothetical protein
MIMKSILKKALMSYPIDELKKAVSDKERQLELSRKADFTHVVHDPEYADLRERILAFEGREQFDRFEHPIKEDDPFLSKLILSYSIVCENIQYGVRMSEVEIAVDAKCNDDLVVIVYEGLGFDSIDRLSSYLESDPTSTVYKNIEPYKEECQKLCDEIEIMAQKYKLGSDHLLSHMDHYVLVNSDME